MTKKIDHLISRIPIFDHFDADDSAVLQKYLSPKELAIGDLVCREGQHGSFLSFVANGKLEVSKTIEDKKVVISIIDEGGTLGEMSLIDGLTRSATAEAITPATILILRRDDFHRLLNEHPQVGIKILKGIARMLSLNLRRTSNQITKYMFSLTQ